LRRIRAGKPVGVWGERGDGERNFEEAGLAKLKQGFLVTLPENFQRAQRECPALMTERLR